MGLHDLVDICEDDLPETISMRLECGNCGHIARYRTKTVFVDPEIHKKSQ